MKQIDNHTPFGHNTLPASHLFGFPGLRNLRPAYHCDRKSARDNLAIHEYLDSKTWQTINLPECLAQNFLSDYTLTRNEIQTDEAKYRQAIPAQAKAHIRLARQNWGCEGRNVFGGKALEVRVEQHEQSTLRHSNAGCHRVTFATILWIRDELDHRKMPDGLSRIVGRTIIHNNNLI